MVTRKVRSNSSFLPFLWKLVQSEFEMYLEVSKLQLLFSIYHLAHRSFFLSFFCWTFINLSQLTARQRQYHNDDAQHLTRSATTQTMMPGTNTQVAAELPCHWPRPRMTTRQRREMEGGDDENRPKRCQTRRLGHRYVFLKFSLSPIILTSLNIQDMRQRVGLYAVVTKTGPNNARRVVWTCRYFF